MRLAFVSGPGGSSFVEELLGVVSVAVADLGVEVVTHRGSAAEVLDAHTVPVLVPHEYFAVLPADLDAPWLSRVVSFGIEHPGTRTFERSRMLARRLGGATEISAESVEAVRTAGVEVEHAPLGYSRVWDARCAGDVRDIDVVFLGTADERRLAVLARIAADLAGLRTEIVLAPHEPMTHSRPDFVGGADKWRLLSRSSILLNLHREASTALETVRILEAVSNGCVVLTEPSTSLDRWVPGEDLVIADPPNLGAVARQLLRDPDRLASLSAHALATAQQPPISAAAEALIRVAERVARRSQGGATLFPLPSRRGGRATAPDRRPLAVWVPQVGRLPGPGHAGDPALAAVVRELADVRRRKAVPTAVPPARPIRTAVLDVVCTACDGDGPLGVTLASLDAALASTGRPDDVAIHVAGVPGTTGVLPPADLPIASWVLWDEPIGRGAARNDLVGRGSAPWLLVLDAGDELLPGVLDLLSAETGSAEPPAAILPLAVLGAEMVVNALPPDPRRLERHAYLGRGYVIRRETLDGVDGFAESPDLAGLEDHVLWNRLAIAQAPVRLVRSFGFRLWPQQAPARLIDLDPGRTAASLRDAIVERPRARSAAR